MAKMRSPNYPAIGLTEAIKALKLLWAKEKRTAVPIEVVGKAMGYISVSGPVRTKIAALRKFGLLDQNNGNYSISNLGMQILHGQANSDELCNALLTAALRPEIFKELRQTHLEASDEALESYLLVKRGFSEAGAKQLIKAFKETMEVAEAASGGNIPVVSEEEPEDGMESQPVVTSAHKTAPYMSPQTPRLNPANQTYVFALSREAKAELSLKGNITSEDLEMLRDHIELTIKALARTAKREAGEA